MKFPSHKPEAILVPAAVFWLAGLLVLLFFPSRPVASIWRGFRVLVVSSEADEQDILGRLEAQGITDTVTLSVSAVRNTSREAPDQPFLSEINARRTAWFVDPERKFRYFYLRETPFLDKKVSEGFAGTPFFRHLETAEGSVFFPPVLASLFLLSALFFAGNRHYQIACGLPFVLLSASCSRISGFMAAVFALQTVILAADILWGRAILTPAQRFRRIRQQPLLAVSVFAAALAAASGGFHPFLLFIAASVSSVSALALVHGLSRMLDRLRDKKRLHPVFRPQAFDTRSMYSGSGKTALAVHLLLAAFAAAGILLFAFSSSGTPAGTETDLYIPSPAQYTDSTGFDLAGYTELAALKEKDGIPDLGDFVASQWRSSTFAWQRLQKPAADPSGESIAEYADYTIDGNGVISEKKRVLETFDTGFIRKTLSRDGTPLEKMLLAQNRFVTVTRTGGNGKRSGGGGPSVLWYLLFLAIPGAVLVMRLKK